MLGGFWLGFGKKEEEESTFEVLNSCDPWRKRNSTGLF